ncbi:MAG: exonuclease SbcCD subunit D C-terminal domain-containing protein [Chloracidobacterium sp.]|nr:exonuclease SbcCD subunit D C-terminal domain-containing protein [Chloracidobacterium sp.]MDW8218716.1 exonuclease SbcCD subunit D C-terminal domain-containing protein [Acidobacteriota bacterium]
MRLLHTADWHLGATLGVVSRDAEQACFLDWLLGVLERERVDALLIAGDVFDAANPPAAAQRLYYDFLAKCRARLPKLDVVVIGGNHDSAGRLDAPADLLAAFNVRVVGGVPRRGDKTLDFERLLVPLTNTNGEVAAWCVAMPFVRPFDVGASGDLVQGVMALYAECFDVARQKRQAGQALVAMGHAFMVNGKVSDTERAIQRGNLDALPVELFPPDVAYVALGHLHRAQRVAGKKHVRYSGSPLPLSMNERHYKHRVVLVDLDGERVRITPLPIPRARDLHRIPKQGAAPLQVILEALRQLPQKSDDDGRLPPLVEVHVAVDQPQPTLKADIDKAVEDKAVEIVAIHVAYPQRGDTPPADAPIQNLHDLQPSDVFLRCYRTKYKDEPPPALCNAFRELLEQTQRECAPETSLSL